jgi:hypothetical protein
MASAKSLEGGRWLNRTFAALSLFAAPASRFSRPLLCIFAVASCHGGAREDALIRDAEGQLSLPQRAHPLDRYDRYYVVEGKTAKGIFIFANGAKGRLSVVRTREERPFVADGGCHVVHVSVDLATKTWDKPFCNGTS